MEWLSETLGFDATQTKIAQTAFLFLALFGLRFAARRFVNRRVDDLDVAYRARKSLGYIFVAVAILALIIIWLEPLGNVGTFLGLTSAGLAIALSDLLKNIAGWVYVVWRRPFRVDDRIEVNGIRGDVVDIRLFRTTLLEIGNWVDADQSTGRIVHVPNGQFLVHAVENSTESFPYIWHEVPVLVTFESDWRLAEQLMLDGLTPLTEGVVEQARASIRQAARDYKIRYTHLTPTVYVSVRDSGVLLTGRLLVPVRQRRSYDQRAWRVILEAFEATDRVELAYPTVRAYTLVPDEQAGRGGVAASEAFGP